MLSAYTLTFGGLLLLGARAGDLYGRRRVFSAGVALFTLASIAGGLATSPAMLLAARAVQGVGARLRRPLRARPADDHVLRGPGTRPRARPLHRRSPSAAAPSA